MGANNVFSGARAIFRINGVKVAYASGCDGSEEIQYENVDVLDNLEVEEHVPVAYRVDFNCAIFRTIRGAPNSKAPREGNFGSLKETGLFPRAGASLFDILTSGEMTVTIVDRVTKKTIMTLEGAKPATNNWSIQARQVVSTNMRWVGKRMKDETGG